MRDALLATIQRLLRPLVRYLLKQGWTLSGLVGVLKVVFVEEALARAPKSNISDSYLSLATGIHRKEVKRLRQISQEGSINANMLDKSNIAAQLVAEWASSADTQGATGEPLRLPLHDPNGMSIENLAQRIKADVRPRAIIDHLLAIGVVATDSEGYLHLLRRAYVPNLPEDKLVFLGDNVGDHLSASLHNLSDLPPFFERALYFEGLLAAELSQLKPSIDASADQLLQDLYRRLAPIENRLGTRRMRIGIYYYEEDTQKTSAPDS